LDEGTQDYIIEGVRRAIAT